MNWESRLAWGQGVWSPANGALSLLPRVLGIPTMAMPTGVASAGTCLAMGRPWGLSARQRSLREQGCSLGLQA